MFKAFEKFGKFVGRETGPFCFMALLAAQGAVPGATALPVPAERQYSLGYEAYGFMDLLHDAGAVPAVAAPVTADRNPVFAEAGNRIAALAASLATDLKFEAYDFMDLLADNGLTPHVNLTEAANDNFFRPRVVPPRAA